MKNSYFKRSLLLKNKEKKLKQVNIHLNSLYDLKSCQYDVEITLSSSKYSPNAL